MKRIIFILALCFLFLCISVGFSVYADTSDYKTFTEIMMSDGKLLDNFTEEEMDEALSNIQHRKFIGFNVYVVNRNVDASYISNTIHSIENTSATDITYDLVYDVETNNKVSVTANASLNGAISSGKSTDMKKELGGKCGVEVSSVTTTSVKKKETTKVIVEANSEMIVYLTGSLSVTNGVANYYYWFFKTYEGGFEIVTLKNQYAMIEKASR